MAYLGEMNKEIEKRQIQEESEDEEQSLWDAFNDMMKDKEKGEKKKFVQLID